MFHLNYTKHVLKQLLVRLYGTEVQLNDAHMDLLVKIDFSLTDRKRAKSDEHE